VSVGQASSREARGPSTAMPCEAGVHAALPSAAENDPAEHCPQAEAPGADAMPAAAGGGAAA
jgi:hypothetical protein